MFERTDHGCLSIDGRTGLVLRPLRWDDRWRLLDWRNRPEVARHMYSDHRIEQGEHDAWFQAALTAPGRRYWIIELDGRPVGLVNLYAIDLAAGSCYWAFYLAESEVRGQGVGRSVEERVLRHVFEDLRLDLLYCEVLARNGAVVRLHESMGFERDALLIRHIRKSDGWHDVVRLRHCRSIWMKRRAERSRTVAVIS